MRAPVLAVFLAIGPASQSTTLYYVDGGEGNDSNPGSYSAPWQTIQRAADLLNPGDTVFVSGGSYNERVQITRSGTPGGVIAFQASGSVLTEGFTILASHVRITGFDIAVHRATSFADRVDGTGIVLSGDSIEITNNHVLESPSSGIFLSSSTVNATIRGNRIAYSVECGIYIQGAGNLIVGNDISHIRSVGGSDADGIRFFGSGNTVQKNYIHAIMSSDSPGEAPHPDAFQTWGPATNYVFEQNLIDKDPSQRQGITIEGLAQPVGDIIIRNNVFISRGTGYQANVNVGDIGLVTNVSIVNNTMVAVNGPAEWAVWIFRNVAGAVVKNNAIFDHGNLAAAYIRVEPGAVDLEIGFNAVSKSDGQPPIGQPNPGDLWMVDPQFVDPATGDFRLQPTSSLVRSGIQLPTVLTDFDGFVRPPEGFPTIGAFEDRN